MDVVSYVVGFVTLLVEDHTNVYRVLLALFLRHPKPFLVNFVAVAGWILLPLSLIGNAAWSRFLERREELHRIRLEEDAEERFEREHIAA